MPEVRVCVRGTRPVPWGDNNQWEWRKALYNEARGHLSSVGSVSNETKFHVSIIFFREKTPKEPDIDNLAKPVLDTIFCSRHYQGPTPSLAGALFNVDDEQVFRLELEKRLVSTRADEGVDITVKWA